MEGAKMDNTSLEVLINEKFSHLESTITAFAKSNDKEHEQYRRDIDGLYEREITQRKEVNDRLDRIADRLGYIDSVKVALENIKADTIRNKENIALLFEENKRAAAELNNATNTLRKEMANKDEVMGTKITEIEAQRKGSANLVGSIVGIGGLLAAVAMMIIMIIQLGG